jgi:hypothetical protein
VTSIAKDVSNREAESICNSVNGMLKTLNGQLMLSVDEVKYDSDEATLLPLRIASIPNRSCKRRFEISK